MWAVYHRIPHFGLHTCKEKNGQGRFAFLRHRVSIESTRLFTSTAFQFLTRNNPTPSRFFLLFRRFSRCKLRKAEGQKAVHLSSLCSLVEFLVHHRDNKTRFSPFSEIFHRKQLEQHFFLNCFWILSFQVIAELLLTKEPSEDVRLLLSSLLLALFVFRCRYCCHRHCCCCHCRCCFCCHCRCVCSLAALFLFAVLFVAVLAMRAPKGRGRFPCGFQP